VGVPSLAVEILPKLEEEARGRQGSRSDPDLAGCLVRNTSEDGLTLVV
jgi:hypothetical protein